MNRYYRTLEIDDMPHNTSHTDPDAFMEWVGRRDCNGGWNPRYSDNNRSAEAIAYLRGWHAEAALQAGWEVAR